MNLSDLDYCTIYGFLGGMLGTGALLLGLRRYIANSFFRYRNTSISIALEKRIHRLAGEVMDLRENVNFLKQKLEEKK